MTTTETETPVNRKHNRKLGALIAALSVAVAGLAVVGVAALTSQDTEPTPDPATPVVTDAEMVDWRQENRAWEDPCPPADYPHPVGEVPVGCNVIGDQG